MQTDTIDAIFKETLSALTEAREQMFDITETARNEYQRVRAALEDLKTEVAQAIDDTDRLEKETRRSRNRLAQVSKDFQRHAERDIQKTYEDAEKLHIELGVARERERSLRKRRDELERTVISLRDMVDKAEKMVSQVSVAVDFLLGNLSRVADEWEGIKARFHVGERIIQAQEEERRRVAREMHDGPAQAMANVVLRAEICEKLLAADRAEVSQELAHLKTLVKDTLTEVRRIIFDLRPMALDDLGLVPTLNRYLEDLKEHEEVPVRLAIMGEGARLDTTLEVALFRMVQEAVNNARKHAEARQIDVRIAFSEDGDAITVEVADDGIGFDLREIQSQWNDRESFGLLSMQERIELLDGEFAVVSIPGRGTRISATLRYPPEDKTGGSEAPKEKTAGPLTPVSREES